MTYKQFRTEWVLDPSKEMIVEKEIENSYKKYVSKQSTIQVVEKRILKAVDKKPAFIIFGYANISLLRIDAKIPEWYSDKEIQNYLNTLLD